MHLHDRNRKRSALKRFDRKHDITEKITLNLTEKLGREGGGRSGNARNEE